MQKLIAIFMLLLSLSCSLVACCANDNCASEEVAASATSDHQDDEDKGGCSPFFNCRTCIGGVQLDAVVPEISTVVVFAKLYPTRVIGSETSYANQFFQPPRV